MTRYMVLVALALLAGCERTVPVPPQPGTGDKIIFSARPAYVVLDTSTRVVFGRDTVQLRGDSAFVRRYYGLMFGGAP